MNKNFKYSSIKIKQEFVYGSETGNVSYYLR